MQQRQVQTVAQLPFMATPTAFLVPVAHHRKHALVFTVIRLTELAAHLAQMVLAAAAQPIPVLAATQRHAAGAFHATKT